MPSQQRMHWRDGSGFTLIEMVVALTVVLVMAGAALLAAPATIKDTMASACNAVADSISNAVTASFASTGDYSHSGADDLVTDGYPVATPDSEQFELTGVSADGVTVEFRSDCSGDTAPSTWGNQAKTDSSYQFGAAGELDCAHGGVCQVGDTGPGGGTVFYVDDTGFEVGNQAFNYLEAARPGWYDGGADPLLKWGCSGQSISGTAAGGIGSGLANTTAWVAAADSTCAGDLPEAASAAFNYGGGEAGWYLPDQAELTQLCRYSSGEDTGPTTQESSSFPCNGQGDEFSPIGLTKLDTYWTSTAFGITNRAQNISMESGAQSTILRTDTARVRPIRYFAKP